MKQHEVANWVKSGPAPELLNAAEKLGRELQQKRLTTSQIRQVFSRLKSVEAKGYKGAQRTEFMMLKPYIAYAAGRPGSSEGTRILKEKVTWGIDAVLADDKNTAEEQRFYNFCKFFEAVLAYHRAHGGK